MSESGFDFIRTLVSGKKKRFIQDGFNLDLTYITERIIAMGYPSSSSIHKLFRNDIEHVYGFFEKYHSGHWRILNVAMEINYDHTRVDGNVFTMGFADHCPPPFHLLLKIIDKIHEWLSKDPLNVIAIHCRAGKGRTGTTIVCYLIYLLKLNCPEIFNTSDSILSNMLTYFNEIRANNQECVSVPSQKRYCGYFIQYLRNQVEYPLIQSPTPLKLLSFEFLGSFSANLTSISIYTRYNPLLKDLPIVIHKNYSNSNGNNHFGNYLKMEGQREISLVGDTLFKVYADGEHCVFKFFIHTSFIPQQDDGYPRLSFNRDLLDGGSSGPLNDVRFKNDFQCRVNLESYPLFAMNYSNSNNNNITPIATEHTNNHTDNMYDNSFKPPTINTSPPPPPIPDRSNRPILSSYIISHPTI